MVDEDGLLEGVASVRELIIAEDPDDPAPVPYREGEGVRVRDILRTNVISVLPTTDQEDVARRMAKYDLNVMPVVDDEGKLLGVITIDDVIDVLVARSRPRTCRRSAASSRSTSLTSRRAF